MRRRFGPLEENAPDLYVFKPKCSVLWRVAPAPTLPRGAKHQCHAFWFKERAGCPKRLRLKCKKSHAVLLNNVHLKIIAHREAFGFQVKTYATFANHYF